MLREGRNPERFHPSINILIPREKISHYTSKKGHAFQKSHEIVNILLKNFPPAHFILALARESAMYSLIEEFSNL